MVEPVDRLSGGELDMVDAAPRAGFLEQLSLVEAVDRLGQRVVEGRADSTGRWPNTGCSETFAVGQRDVLGQLNRSTQHRLVGLSVAARRTPPPGCSSQGLSGVDC